MNINPVMKDIEQRLMAVTEADMDAVSLPVRAPNAVVTAERVCKRIRRLRALKETVERECQTLAGKDSPEWTLKDAFREIIGQILDLEVWREYPVLAGKEYTLYSDRSIGPQENPASIELVGLVDIYHAYVSPPPGALQ